MQRILTGTLVAAVSTTCLVSAVTSGSASTASGQSSLQAKKEYRLVVPAKKEYSKKEYRIDAGKKEYSKKEYRAALAKKEYAKKEYRASAPSKKEYSKKEYRAALAKKEYAKKEYRALGLSLVAQTASPAFGVGHYEQRVVQLVNRTRRAHHLRTLTVASCTQRVAARWSAHLAATNGFHHQSMQRLLRRCDARYVGETLGRGSISPATLVRMWMNSPPHRHVLMSHSPRHIGVGATPDSHGQWVVAANFMSF